MRNGWAKVSPNGRNSERRDAVTRVEGCSRQRIIPLINASRWSPVARFDTLQTFVRIAKFAYKSYNKDDSARTRERLFGVNTARIVVTLAQSEVWRYSKHRASRRAAKFKTRLVIVACSNVYHNKDLPINIARFNTINVTVRMI